jgi:phage-related protein
VRAGLIYCNTSVIVCIVDVRFYRTAGGEEPVREYLRGLPLDERRLVGAAIRALQSCGLSAPGLVTRQLDGKLWEIKASAERVLYCVSTGPVVWLLHAYRKATQKAPRREVGLARARMKEVLR